MGRGLAKRLLNDAPAIEQSSPQVYSMRKHIEPRIYAAPQISSTNKYMRYRAAAWHATHMHLEIKRVMQDVKGSLMGY